LCTALDLVAFVQRYKSGIMSTLFGKRGCLRIWGICKLNLGVGSLPKF
jgi:hypothetical protein